MEIVEGATSKDSSSYKQQDLKKYEASSYKPGTPYITAVLTSKEIMATSKFTVGNGKTTRIPTSRRKRQTRAVAEEYSNTALKPLTKYSVFIRAATSTVCV